MKTIIKSKSIKKVAIITLLCLAIIVLCLVLFVQSSKAAYAFVGDEFAQGVYIVDGSTVDGDIVVERGTFITIVVSYNGNSYIPQLYTDTDMFACEIEGNVFAIKENSYIGGSLYLYAIITVNDEIITLQPAVVVPVWESNFSEKITSISSHDNYEISFTDPNIVSVKADISMKNGKTSKVLTNGSDIGDVINIAKHGYADLILDYDEITVNTSDNLGNLSAQTVTNGQDNLSIATYASVALSGSGTKSSPYLIYSLGDLDLLQNYDNTNVCFEQRAAFTVDRAPVSRNHDFLGIYNGNGLCLTVDGLSGVSSIICRYNYGTIQSIIFDIYSYSTSGIYAGVVCVKNYGTILYCMVSTNNAPYPLDLAKLISGEQNIEDIEATLKGDYAPIKTSALGFGGIAATNYGIIQECVACFTIRSNFVTGGIVGANTNNAKVDSCMIWDFYVLGAQVSPLFLAGGAVGNNNSGGYVRNCSRGGFGVIFNTESPNTLVPRVGGIIGNNSSDCYRVFNNTFNNSSYYHVDGYPNLLDSPQRVYIGNVYGYGEV